MRRRVALALTLLAGTLAFWHALPDPLFRSPVSRVLLDRDGVLLGASIAADEQWRFPPAARVPERYRTAVLRFEDHRFERHPGIDPLAVLRAARTNWRAGRIVSGASTISMQVVRLAREGRPRTLREKLTEALLALRLELAFDKDEILALYAGHAPFGGNVVGLEAAAWRYFGRAPGDLSWAESATLAVLPNSPALIHPGRNRETLRAKRDALLQRLQDEGHLDAMELSLALHEPLPQAPRALPRLAPHLLETLATRHPNRSRFTSTLDQKLQGRAIERVRSHAEHLAPEGIRNAAALVIDNRSFEVVAYVGNAYPQHAMTDGHAVDIVGRPRSTGSLLKPLLFAAMIENGDLLPETLVSDVPTQYQGYMPENFDRTYRGAVPAGIALARSLNVPAVRMLRRYGVARFRSLLTTLGMTTLHRDADDYGLALILGGAEGTLWELTEIYANLAHIAGARPQSPALRTATWLADDTRREAGPDAPFGPGAAWLTLDALSDVTRPDSEGAWREFANARHIAWKTGTSYGLRDAWAIGTTPEYTVGVWIGNASGAGVAGLSGVDSAAPLLFDLFDGLPRSGPFSEPHRHLQRVQVCAEDGYLANDLCRTREALAPRDTRFSRVSPFHLRVHLDASETVRVDSRCADAREIRTRPWFVLPPREEHYYRTHHPEYRPLPPVRRGCAIAQAQRGPIALLYPDEGSAVYVPTDLDGEPSRAVFEAVHREPDATLHWHLDAQYVATTQAFHQIEVEPAPGRHRLTLVDQTGRMIERTFEVLGEERR